MSTASTVVFFWHDSVFAAFPHCDDNQWQNKQKQQLNFYSDLVEMRELSGGTTSSLQLDQQWAASSVLMAIISWHVWSLHADNVVSQLELMCMQPHQLIHCQMPPTGLYAVYVVGYSLIRKYCSSEKNRWVIHFPMQTLGKAIEISGMRGESNTEKRQPNKVMWIKMFETVRSALMEQSLSSVKIYGSILGKMKENSTEACDHSAPLSPWKNEQTPDLICAVTIFATIKFLMLQGLC